MSGGLQHGPPATGMWLPHPFSCRLAQVTGLLAAGCAATQTSHTPSQPCPPPIHTPGAATHRVQLMGMPYCISQGQTRSQPPRDTEASASSTSEESYKKPLRCSSPRRAGSLSRKGARMPTMSPSGMPQAASSRRASRTSLSKNA